MSILPLAVRGRASTSASRAGTSQCGNRARNRASRAAAVVGAGRGHHLETAGSYAAGTAILQPLERCDDAVAKGAKPSGGGAAFLIHRPSPNLICHPEGAGLPSDNLL